MNDQKKLVDETDSGKTFSSFYLVLSSFSKIKLYGQAMHYFD